MTEHDSELQVISRTRDGRRRYDEQGKRALIEAALRPGTSVAVQPVAQGLAQPPSDQWFLEGLARMPH